LPAPDLERRRAGVLLHLTSLPGSGGIGSLGKPAVRFLDWMQAHGLSVWQFLPTGPTGYGNSPYQPLSVFAGNPLLIDLATLVDWGLLRPAEARPGLRLREGPVDFARVIATHQPLLELAAGRLLKGSDSRLKGELDAFCEKHGATWLDDFAAFVVLKARHGQQAWPVWDPPFRRHHHGAVPECRRHFGKEWQQARAIQYLYARQWQSLREQATRRGILLFGDVPIYMALDCAEAWARPELLALDADLRPIAVAGVPPDYFSADGQLWGNPLYRWDVHAADGFRWWIARLRHALGAADLVRLDHFRGFEAYWSVPYGAATAREGQWLPGPGSALFDALRAALGRVACVAEDLGLITEAVIELRKTYALPGMQVLQFLVDRPGFDPAAIDEDCACYTGTHDNDTTAGWFAGSGGRLGGEALAALRDTVARNVDGAGESIHKAMISLCLKSRARFAMAPLQDYLGLGSEARMNTPGQPEGNWRWRPVASALDTAAMDWVAPLVRATGRA
jgi:4-alpha-glucanotransferase